MLSAVYLRHLARMGDGSPFPSAFRTLDGPVDIQTRERHFDAVFLAYTPQIRDRLLWQLQSLSPKFRVVTVLNFTGIKILPRSPWPAARP